MILSEMWDATEPRPLWKRAFDSLPADRVEFVAAVTAYVYVGFVVVVGAGTLRP